MRKTNEAHLQNRRAFTLVELMVAILILLIGVTSILSILPLAFHIQRNSKDVIMSEILARNAASMLSARKIKYSDLRKAMLTSDFDVFQPMDPLNYAGSTSYRSDGKDSSSKSGNSLLYADTGRMAFPLPNGRVNTYGEVLGDAISEYRDQLKTFILSRHDGEVYDQTIVNDILDNFCYPLWGDAKDGYGRSIVYYGMEREFDNYIGDTIDEAKAHTISRDWKAISDDRWESLMESNDVRLTTGGKNDFDERAQGYGLTGSTSASRDRSRHLWGYNKSQNMMATYDGTGDAPAYLWTIRDRSFPSLSKKKIGKRDYFWVPLLFDADPRPGRFEWRAYVVVTVRFPGRNYKYQGQVHTDHGTSVQAFAANPRDPDTVPRVTAVPMDMANSGISGSKVQRYSGGAYGPLNYVYYPDYPDTSSTATIQSSVSRGYMSKQDDWEITGPDDPAGKTNQHHGYVSGRFIPGDKFEITVNQPKITHYRDFQSNGWVLAGSTPTFLLRANNFTGSNNSAIKHPVPYWESHYNPRNSSFKMWTWMSHNNGVGNISVGRIMPVSGLVVDMGD